MVAVDWVIPTEKPNEDVIQSYTFMLSHCTPEEVVEILPPLQLLRANGGYYLIDGHHRLEVLKSFGASHTKAKEVTLDSQGYVIIHGDL